MKIKKIAAAGLSGIMLLGIMSGCGGKTGNEEEMNAMFSELNTVDLDGNQITESIFKENDLTMINTWATWCGPCVGELPELEELQKQLQEEGKKVSVKGMVIGGEGEITAGLTEEEKKEAKNVLKEAGATYQQILVSEKLAQSELKNQAGLPTTYFVDKQGKLVGEPVTGANDVKGWKEEVEKKLKACNNHSLCSTFHGTGR